MTEALGQEAVAFIDANRTRPFFVYLPFNAVHAPMQSTQPYLDRFAGVEGETRRTHLAMLAALDDQVGAVVAAVKRNGLEDNTLIIFASDNGGPTPQTTSTNAPLRGFKGQVLEGGIRVPYIFAWKGHLPAGKVYDRPVMGFDITATALAAAGVKVSGDRPLDGVDVLPYLRGAKAGDPHRDLFWRSGSQGAIREGDWKLVMMGGTTALYDLSRDIGEANDLAAKDPARTARLKSTFNAWSAAMMAPQWKRNELAEDGE
jgi:arylsulfatase A-like enzyme